MASVEFVIQILDKGPGWRAKWRVAARGLDAMGSAGRSPLRYILLNLIRVSGASSS